jgi:hypothetical protein
MQIFAFPQESLPQQMPKPQKTSPAMLLSLLSQVIFRLVLEAFPPLLKQPHFVRNKPIQDPLCVHVCVCVQA